MSHWVGITVAVSTAPAHDHPAKIKPMKGAGREVFLSDLSVEAQCVEALCFNALCFNALCFNARV